MKNRFKLCLLTVIIVLTSVGCNNSKPAEAENYYMGTIINQKAFGKNAKTAVNKVTQRMLEIEKLMTINAPGGEINAINEKAGKEFVKVSDTTFDVLKEGKLFGQLSKGKFDITIGPLVKEWGVFTDNPKVPTKDKIEELKKLINYNDLELDEVSKSAKLKRPNQMLDLGGIAKGFAGDEAIKIYKENGVQSAFINLGGNVVLLGSKPDGTPWKIGVQNPRAINGKYIGVLEVSNKAIVSSGDYERFFEKDGKRYHHILDPNTGYPAENGLIGTTIVSDRSIDGDCLSTSTFLLGLEEGRKLVESIDGVDAIFITSDKKVYVTSGLKDKFTFDDESGEFQYVQER